MKEIQLEELKMEELQIQPTHELSQLATKHNTRGQNRAD